MITGIWCYSSKVFKAGYIDRYNADISTACQLYCFVCNVISSPAWEVHDNRIKRSEVNYTTNYFLSNLLICMRKENNHKENKAVKINLENTFSSASFWSEYKIPSSYILDLCMCVCVFNNASDITNVRNISKHLVIILYLNL